MRSKDDVMERVLLFWRERHRAGNQSDLAKVLGVSPQVVTNWKRRGLPSHKLPFVASRLGRTIYELLGLPEPTWPFEVPRSQFEALSPQAQAVVSSAVSALIRGYADAEKASDVRQKPLAVNG